MRQSWDAFLYVPLPPSVVEGVICGILRMFADQCGTLRSCTQTFADIRKVHRFNRRALRRERSLLPTLGDVSQAAQTLGLGEELIGLLLRLERQFDLPICKDLVRELLGLCEIES